MCRAYRVSMLASFLIVAPIALAEQETVSLTGAALYEKVSSTIVLVKTEKGAGTGFVINPNGTIATAYHVIQDAKQVGIKTTSGEIFDNVTLLARDERRDVAILKVPGFEMPTVGLGNSNEVRPGQRIFVIGNPLGTERLQATITDGIVSGIRDFGEGYKVVQITAAISPGNSGGPLLDEKGNAIGVVTFKIVAGESLNFAVPINYVRGMLDSVAQSSPVQHWQGSGGPNILFGEGKGGGLTDYWKSSNGNLYYIKDHGDQVKILNVTSPSYTYDFKWFNGLVIGLAYGPGDTQACALKKIDEDHLHRVCFKHKSGFDDSRIQQEAEKRFKKPRDIWVRMR